MTNPYESPALEPESTEFDSSPRASGKLYSPGQAAWATFLGGPLAGCVLMAINYSRLGRRSSAWWSLGAGAIATLVLLVLAFVLPENSPTKFLPLVVVLGVYHAMKSQQGAALTRHLSRGGKKASTWMATGIGILGLLLTLGAILAVVLVLPEDEELGGPPDANAPGSPMTDN